ncbi:UvrD-helicase domain-containing protein [Yimella sp. RIT 621]|uniref:UvrD-helicase domain-containing protein n=1 Tax=Yimella sp. RIT 621 TaxID=2510323 RepID=UPI00197A7DCD|nr:UvrD-helicase domain-containing protein [Yimella sp. RIT 621]
MSTETFEITGPLPEGTTLIEASAGTGKTWTVAALATRYVVEQGMPIDKLLIVTFSRAASQELRERVRARLEETLAELESSAPTEDPLVEHLRDCAPAELALRVRRLRTAVADFDTATIATIHQFCHYVLRGLGVAGDSDPGATLAEDLEQLQSDVIDDLFLADHLRAVSGTPEYAIARKDARHALNNPGAELHPTDASGPLGVRMDLVRRVREEFEKRKRRAAVLSYDDLLEQLADALEDEGGPARRRMRDRWSVVLVDEFQDTDPVQWQVFSRAFACEGISLLLIGDPKQAIYAFRGGDIHTYLQAADTADRRTSLPTNYRSDEPLVRSLQTLMNGVALSEGIVVHPVTAHHKTHRLSGSPDDTPVRLRTWPLIDGERQPSIGDVRRRVYPDVADDIERLLASGAELDGRPVQPQDIAVLCHVGSDLAGIREELRRRGIASVLVSGTSVLRTPAAEAWLELLMALEQPHRRDRVGLAALTPFIGWTAEQLDSADETEIETVAAQIRSLITAFHRGGVAAVLDVARSQGLAERVLGQVGGERDLTDIEHCAQVLHEQVLQGMTGLPSLIAWMMKQSADDAVTPADSRTMRLDSDALAVTLSTIHSSKGLQYPIVYAPFLFNNWLSDKEHAVVVHRDGHRILSYDRADLNGSERRADDLGEHMRLAYVAMTRAQSQLVLWWAPTYNSKDAGLHRLLFGQAPTPEALDQLLRSRTHGNAAESHAGRVGGSPDNAAAPHAGRVGGSPDNAAEPHAGRVGASPQGERRDRDHGDDHEDSPDDLTGSRSRSVDNPASLLDQRAVITLLDPIDKHSIATNQRFLQTWADHGAFSLEVIGSGTTQPAPPVEPSTERLTARWFDDSIIDRDWRRASYSSLAAAGEAAAEAAGELSEPEDGAVGRIDEEVIVVPGGFGAGDFLRQSPGSTSGNAGDFLRQSPGSTSGNAGDHTTPLGDEPKPGDGNAGDHTTPLIDVPKPGNANTEPSPMADLPVGATFGSLVHAVLEHADLQARDLRANLFDNVREQLVLWPVDLDPGALVDAMEAVCTTPMGPEPDAPRLVDIAKTDRFSEMDFEMPLAGGDRPHARPVLREMAEVLRTHLSDDDPLIDFADALAGDAYGNQTLLGYLTGSVDLTFRHDGRFYIVDYKTNWLGEPGEPLTLADYEPARLNAAMGHSSYPLQAILYSIVLHRYLRWRLPAYDPGEHFGGVMYLYVRGMAGPATPVVDGGRCGVFTWHPPAAILDDLSKVLDGGER